MILLPFGLLLVTGIFTAEPLMRILIGLADIALLTLMINAFYKRTKWTTLFEVISFFCSATSVIENIYVFFFQVVQLFSLFIPSGLFYRLFPTINFSGP